jgi:hypothetical protein
MSGYSDKIIADGGANLLTYLRLNDVTATNSAAAAYGSGGAFYDFVAAGPVKRVGQQDGPLLGDADKAYKFYPGGGVYWSTGTVNTLSQALDGTADIVADFWLNMSDTTTGANTDIVALSCGNDKTEPISPTANVKIFHLYYTGTNGFVLFARSNGEDAGNTLTCGAGSALVAGTWYHIVAKVKFGVGGAGLMQLYINGNLIASEAKTFAAATFTYSAMYNSGASGDFDRIVYGNISGQGSGTTKHVIMDEFALFKADLSASQIADHFVIGKQWRHEIGKRTRNVAGAYSVRHLGI